ncbi:MAG: site-specific DNA-methyltransferase [Chthonomonadales bacterium]|nr:site-specific DNA-methyltransferase [Chthonomonadales bacterium]
MSDHDVVPVNSVIVGDCIEVMAAWPDATFDLIFADPPYNLQLRNELWRPNESLVDAVDDAWDKIGSFADYDRFSRAWLSECRRLLKPNGAIWVIGTYHNIYRLGALMQDLGFWFLNDVVWVKSNPMPNFRGVRLTNAHETLIWAARSDRSRHTFNHHAAKTFNGGKQLRSDWRLPICCGSERLKADGRKLHSTQKPEALIERIVVISTRPGDLILDPFFGSGTTGAVAKRLQRRWVGIEREPTYAEAARRRIADVIPDPLLAGDERRRPERIPFRTLVERGILRPGQTLCFRRDSSLQAVVTSSGHLRRGAEEGSIHRLGSSLSNGAPCNGWDHWYFEAEDGTLQPIGTLREMLRDLDRTQG